MFMIKSQLLAKITFRNNSKNSNGNETLNEENYPKLDADETNAIHLQNAPDNLSRPCSEIKDLKDFFMGELYSLSRRIDRMRTETLWKRTVSAEFWVIPSKLCGNCVFPQNFHTRKLSTISVFYAM